MEIAANKESLLSSLSPNAEDYVTKVTNITKGLLFFVLSWRQGTYLAHIWGVLKGSKGRNQH